MKSSQLRKIGILAVISLILLIAWMVSLKYADGVTFTAGSKTVGMSSFNGNAVIWFDSEDTGAMGTTSGIDPFHGEWEESDQIKRQRFGRMIVEPPGARSGRVFLVALPYWLLITSTLLTGFLIRIKQ